MAITEHPWRDDPSLVGRFHEAHPDDLQVLCHDGEPRRTNLAPELCWVRVTGVEPWRARPLLEMAESAAAFEAAMKARAWGPLDRVYVGTLLNEPTHLTTVQDGDDVRFIAAPGLEHALMVTAAYLVERPSWAVAPCAKCGFHEGLDPPSVMARTRFPAAPADASTKTFTAFCPLCGGTMMFARRDGAAHAPAAPKGPWWKFWA